MSKTPRQDALQPPRQLKPDWWVIGFSAVFFLFSCLSLFFYVNREHSYTIQCAVFTPSGPVPTVNLKAHNVIVTDFGIIKSKEGIYIPTTNEICVIAKESE